MINKLRDKLPTFVVFIVSLMVGTILTAILIKGSNYLLTEYTELNKTSIYLLSDLAYMLVFMGISAVFIPRNKD